MNRITPRTNTDKIIPSPRCREKHKTDLFGYLYGHQDLIVHFDVAHEFGFSTHTFADILEAGIGPDYGPGLANDHFWFTKDQARIYWRWLCKEASDEDLKEICEIIRRNDEIGDYKFAYKREPREMIFCALESRRGYCRYYSKRLKIRLISPDFEVPHMIADPESVQR